MLLVFGKLFFGGSSDPGGLEKHNGIKSLGGGRGVPVARRLKLTLSNLRNKEIKERFQEELKQNIKKLEETSWENVAQTIKEPAKNT